MSEVEARRLGALLPFVLVWLRSRDPDRISDPPRNRLDPVEAEQPLVRLGEFGFGQIRELLPSGAPRHHECRAATTLYRSVEPW